MLPRTHYEVSDTPARCLSPDGASALVERALRVLDGRWKLAIVFRLFGTPVLRFSELEKSIGGVSQKVLTQQLRELERDGVCRAHSARRRPAACRVSTHGAGQRVARAAARAAGMERGTLSGLGAIVGQAEVQRRASAARGLPFERVRRRRHLRRARFSSSRHTADDVGFHRRQSYRVIVDSAHGLARRGGDNPELGCDRLRGFIDQRRYLHWFRCQRSVTRRQCDRLLCSDSRRHAFLVFRINHPVVAGDLIPRRLAPPRWSRHFVCGRTAERRLLGYGHDQRVVGRQVVTEAFAEFSLIDPEIPIAIGRNVRQTRRRKVLGDIPQALARVGGKTPRYRRARLRWGECRLP